jgi:tetratricopeptide (TPR) repeat protein
LLSRFVQIEYESKYDRLRHHAYIPFVDAYAAAYRKRVFDTGGGFDPVFPVPSAEDIELSFRLAEQGYKMVFAPDAVVYHCHNESLAGYLRRKFTYGYWRVLVYRRYPARAVEDTHTPQTQKLQVIALPLSLLALASAVVWPPALTLFLVTFVLFWLSALPLITRALRQDICLGMVTALLVPLRAGAIASGLATGVLASIAHEVMARFRNPKSLFAILGCAIGLLFLTLQADLASAWLSNNGAISMVHALDSPYIPPPERELALQRAEAHLRTALTLNPRLQPAIRQLGRVQLTRGQSQLAVTTLSRALDLNPGDMLSHWLLAQAYDGLGENEAAIHEWRTIGTAAPYLAEWQQAAGPALYFANLSNSTLQEDDPETALTYALRALEIDPGCAWAHRATGRAYQVLGVYDRAMQAYQAAIESSHQLASLERAQVHRDLGRLLLESGYPVADAIEQLEEALRLGPRESEAHILMGLASETRGDVDQAIQWYKSAIEVNHRDEFAYLHLAELYESQGRLTDALDWYRQAVANRSDSAEAHFHLGAFYQRRGDLETALAELQTAVKLAPRNRRFHLALADAYRAAGKLAQAVQEYEVVLYLDSDNEAARQALARLRGSAP